MNNILADISQRQECVLTQSYMCVLWLSIHTQAGGGKGGNSARLAFKVLIQETGSYPQVAVLANLVLFSSNMSVGELRCLFRVRVQPPKAVTASSTAGL